MLDEQSGKGLFLGIGIITGQLEKNGRKRNLSAPLFFCGVELETDEGNPGRTDFEIVWESLSLNYDLMTLFLEQKAPEDVEDAFPGAFAFDNRVSIQKLKVLADVERELDRGIERPEYQSQLEQGPKLRELMKLLRDNIPELGGVALSSEPYEHASLGTYVNEVEELFRWLKFLIRHRGYLEDAKLRQHGFSPEKPPSIGIISFLTNQRNYIQTRIDEEFQDDEIKAHDLMAGTPEDFQGNERNIIFLTLGLDGTSKWSKAHYENPNRFNVATSRAIDFTYLIFGGLPATAALLKRYLRHFGETWNSNAPAEDDAAPFNPTVGRFQWRYNSSLRESEFEIRVDEHLHELIEQNGGPKRIKIYNQVGASNEPGVISCGQKRLDFVLFCEENGECCAVEVDGSDHFCTDGRAYSEAHVERVDILKRAGWKIVHVPYYRWYQGGWLCDRDQPEFRRAVEALFAEVRAVLRI